MEAGDHRLGNDRTNRFDRARAHLALGEGRTGWLTKASGSDLP